ncbi:MAG: phosphatase PAP2 family protein [Cellulomonas sp.]
MSEVSRPAARTSRAASRYGARAVLGAVAVVLVAVPFVLLLVLVEDKWSPLAAADQGARDDLHRYALAHAGFVAVMRFLSDSGSAHAWVIIMALVMGWLLWRRLWRLASFVAVTGVGSSLLNTAVKTLVHRPRPVVDLALVHEPGASFPSGHAQAAVTGYGILLLVFLPVLRGYWRRAAIAVAVVMVVGIGFSRVALAAHFVSDVVAGFILGAAWLAAMTALFSAWRVQRGRPAVQPAQGLAPEQAVRLDPTQPDPPADAPAGE